jgi:hypothetical protein
MNCITMMNNSGHMLSTTTSPHTDSASIEVNVLCRAEKRPLTSSEETSPPQVKKLRTLRPKSPIVSYSSPYSTPAISNQYHNPAIRFDSCTTLVTGSMNSAEFYVSLTEYLSQTYHPDRPLKVSDFDFKKWFIDMKDVMNFDPQFESLQYRSILRGLIICSQLHRMALCNFRNGVY